MRSKTTKLRHERSNPNTNSRVVDFSECRHKTYHHVRKFELILNIFLKNWCGRRRPSYDMNDPTLTLTVGLWTFQNVDTKTYHNVRNFELNSKYIFEKLMRSKTTKLRHERSNPNPNSRVVDFSECRHKNIPSCAEFWADSKLYFWKIDAVEDDQVKTWTIQP